MYDVLYYSCSSTNTTRINLLYYYMYKLKMCICQIHLYFEKFIIKQIIRIQHQQHHQQKKKQQQIQPH